MTLAVEHIGHEAIAERVIGAYPAGYAEFGILKTERFPNPTQDPLISTPSGYRLDGPYCNRLPLNTAGRRILAVIDGKLVIWGLPPELLKNLAGPLRVELEQSTLAAEYGKPAVLKHTVLGGTPPFRIQLYDGSGVTESETGDYVLDTRTLFETPSVERYVGHADNELLTESYLERTLGRRPEGLVCLEEMLFQVTDASKPAPGKVEIQYYVLFEIPPAVSGPILEARQKASEKTKAAQQENYQKMASEADRRRKAERTMKARKAVWTAIAGAIWVGWPLIVACHVWAFLFLTRPRGPSQDRHTRRIMGVLIAFGGMVPLLILLIVGFLGIRFPIQEESWPLLIRNLFVFMTLMFITGTTVTATAKGYSAATGIVLGLLSPLGLLILVLLPEGSGARDVGAAPSAGSSPVRKAVGLRRKTGQN